MSRRLQIVNLLGVLVLGVLCVVQWKQNRHLNLEINRLEKSQQDLETRAADVEKKLKAASEDGDYFRAQLSKTAEALHDSEQKLNKSQAEVELLTLQTDQLRTAITNWSAAVEARDEQIRKLANDLNSSIEKYNRLATNHNALVKDYNELSARLTAQQQGKNEAGK